MRKKDVVHVTISGVASASPLVSTKTRPDIEATPLPLAATDGAFPTEEAATPCLDGQAGDL